MADMTLNPFPHQKSVLLDVLRGIISFLVILSGRGAGKTSIVEYIIVGFARMWLKAGGHWDIVYATPTKSGQGTRPWRFLKSIFGKYGHFSDYAVKMDDQAKIIVVGDPVNASKSVTIRLIAGKGRDSSEHEGTSVHLLIVEEAGSKYMVEDIYNSLAPSVSRVNGITVIIGTPPKTWEECVTGWFRRMYDMAASGEYGGYRAVTWETWDNPVYGGYLMDKPLSVRQMAEMRVGERKEYEKTFEVTDEKVTQLFTKIVQNPHDMEIIRIMSSGDDGHESARLCAERVLASRLKTIRDIIRLIDNNQPEEAEREYEGKWLPRPASISEEDLNFVQSCVRNGERYLIDVNGEFVPSNSYLTIWEMPDPAEQYVVSCDTGGGLGGDASAIGVLKRPRDGRPGRLVALLHSNEMPADVLGRKAYYLAMFYNYALVVIERTGAWGVTALVAVRDLAVDKDTGVWIYDDTSKEPQLVSSIDERADKFGWNTSKSSDAMMITTLRRVISERQFYIPSQVVYNELVNFNWITLSGKPDDTVKMLAFGIQAMEWVPPEMMEARGATDDYDAAFDALLESVGG